MARKLLLSLPAVLAGLAAIAACVPLRPEPPERSGELALSGLSAPVEIRFDAYAVPTILASSDADAYFALGFLHARDRLWGMETMRRTGAGRLSEIAGERTLERDLFMRRLGLYELAQESYGRLAPGTRAALDAYAAGVNAHIKSRSGPLPLEFQLLGFEPEPWRPADSLVWNWLISLQLGENFREELTRAALLQRFPAEDVADLYVDDLALPPASLHPALREVDFGAMLDQLPPPLLAAGSASNQWAIDGEMTESGAPLLANDPHLALQAPIQWWLARIETPTLELAGATVPGVPFHVLGHNGRIAWGITAAVSDVQDLFVERVDPRDPARYLTPRGARRFHERPQIVRVDGADPVRLAARETRHGPGLFECAAEAGAPPPCVVSLAFGDLEPNRSAEALYRLNRATDWESFRKAAAELRASQVNIGYADREGGVGFFSSGHVPIRKAGHGRTPKPGWSGAFDWQDVIPTGTLPQALDPPSGRFVNANEPIVGDDYPYLLSARIRPAFRAERIHQLLSAEAAHDVEDMAAIQLDAVSLAARRLSPLLLAAEPASARGQTMLAELERWDGAMAPGLAAPLIYDAFLQTLSRRLLVDELGPLAPHYGQPDPRVVAHLVGSETRWCDDVLSAPRETCADILSLSLDEAGRRLAEQFGKDVSAWRWGEAHVAPFDNAVVSRIPILRSLLDIGTETAGGDHTVRRTASMAWPEVSFLADHGAGYRGIYDLADLDASRFVIATGQSGDPLSPHYDDMIPLWRDGRYLTLPNAAHAGEPNSVLRLTPG